MGMLGFMVRVFIYHLLKLLVLTLMVVITSMLISLIILNWIAGCETWDRQQWSEGEEHSCITPLEIWNNFGAAHSDELDLNVRERQNEMMDRISPSWADRLEQRDREWQREEQEQRLEDLEEEVDGLWQALEEEEREE